MVRQLSLFWAALGLAESRSPTIILRARLRWKCKQDEVENYFRGVEVAGGKV